MKTERVRWTINALRAGQLAVVVLLGAALALELADATDSGTVAARLGALLLIAVPALALAATALETWRGDRTTAVLAAVVIAVLGVAVAVAAFAPL